MSNSKGEFHACLFPMMLHGHTIPFLSMALMFAKHGGKVTFVTTHKEASHLSNQTSEWDLDINVRTLTFPSEKADYFSDDNIGDMMARLIQGVSILSSSLEKVLVEEKPTCLVFDMFFPWCVEVGEKVGVPTIMFGGTNIFAAAAHECIRRHKPHLDVSSDVHPFTIPDLPGNIQLTRGRLPAPLLHDSPFSRLLDDSKAVETRAHGLLMNTFNELEAPYIDCYTNKLGRRVWNIGPLSLFQKTLDAERKATKGKDSMRDDNECIKWLNSKKPHSVIYICFGSAVSFSPSQLREIASALFDSGLSFVWVVKKPKGSKNGELSEWLPEGFEEGTEGRGMIITGWASQVMILEHEAVGGFVTHCGWNSSLEAISAGVPMVTWPVVAEQFFNEILLTDVLKVGVSVGAKTWGSKAADITRKAIEKAMLRLMVGEEADDIRSRARELSSAALKAVQGGSSSCELRAFIAEFTAK